MPKYVELSIDGVIHESEIFGAAMPREPQKETKKDADAETAPEKQEDAK